jgi:glycolate oxidase FAD binding subunit
MSASLPNQSLSTSSSACFAELSQGIAAGVIANDAATIKAHAVDGLSPLAVAFPTCDAELTALLQTASKHSVGVVLWGGGTQIAVGKPPARLDLVISTARLNQLVSHEPDNFTITAQAGMTLAQLQAIAATHNQFLPLDPPSQERATIGGIVATGRTGPWQLRYGSCRDLVLGIKFALGDGRIVSFGGKTMKNVAGYDVHKLLIGSHGTLGAICEVTFRLYATPQVVRSYQLAAPDADTAFKQATCLCPLQPAALLVLEPVAAQAVTKNNSPGWLVFVEFMGDEVVVAEQAKRVSNEIGVEVMALGTTEQTHMRAAIHNLLTCGNDNDFFCRANLPPAELPKWGRQWLALRHEMNLSGASIFCPGTGRAWCGAGGVDSAVAAQLVNKLRAHTAAQSGNLIIESAPAAWKAQLDIWGPPPESVAILRQIKQLFDPAGILSPGRMGNV